MNRKKKPILVSAFLLLLSIVLMVAFTLLPEEHYDDAGKLVMPKWQAAIILILLAFFLILCVSTVVLLFLYLREEKKIAKQTNQANQDASINFEHSTKECPSCHVINDKDAMFCKSCGTALVDESTIEQREADVIQQFTFSERVSALKYAKALIFADPWFLFSMLFVIAISALLVAVGFKNLKDVFVVIGFVMIGVALFMLFMVYVLSPLSVKSNLKRNHATTDVLLTKERIVVTTHLAEGSATQQTKSMTQYSMYFQKALKATEDKTVFYFVYQGPNRRNVCLILSKEQGFNEVSREYLHQKVLDVKTRNKNK